MTSSVPDGDGAGCESPAPPAFSPLTDPADPGNREPSVGVPITDPDAADDAAHASHRSARTPAADHHDDTAANRADAESQSRINGDQNAAHLHLHSHSHSHSQTEPATPATPATPAPRQPHIMDGAIAMALDLPMHAPMDYTTSSGLDFYSPYHAQQPSSAQLLMTLAQLSAASQSQMVALPPPTVRPSQVSLPHPQSMPDASDALMRDAPNAANHHPPADSPLESFARIEFADSVFQMTTYAVIIGRDQRALDQARRDERRQDDYQRRVRENEQMGLPAPSPPTQDRGKFSKSYVSEEGGMLGPESDGDDNPRPSKRRKMSGGAASGSGDSHQVEPVAAELLSLEDKNPTLNRQYVSHTPGAAAVNLSALRPSPYYVPFIGIHSPGPSIASRTKAISREHLKIEFNQKEGVFEAIPLHKNGFFCEDVHYKDEKVVLRSGDRLQIKDVDFVFIVNGVPRGKTGAEDGIDEDGVSSRRYSEGGKEMSFDFENSHDPERRSTSPEEVPAMAAKEDSDSELSDPADDLPDAELEETPEQEVMETIEQDPEAPPTIKPETSSLDLLADLAPIMPKKRGPGRPPKNGIMSKREERLRKKAALELAKKNMPQPPPGEPPIKRKVGRPRKHPLPENAPDRPEKRKYKPRKSKNGEEGEVSDVEKTIKERRREKPKTPPLELNRENYTEEQLQKPPKNYGMLIDEVLTAAPDGLTLKQIYKRIQTKYPFYYFTVDTKGWESSVRHNLIGNDAFKKNEETHLWSRVPGIDIDAGKKRTKATSPDQANTSMHTFGQHYATSATPTPQMFHAETGLQQGYRSGSVPQRTGYGPGHGQVALGQHAQLQLNAQAVGAATQQAPRQNYPDPAQAQGAAPTAGYGNQAAAHPPQGNAQATAYSSPYASRPPPATTAQPGGALPQGAARQGLPHNHVPSPVNGLPRAGPSSAHAAAPPVGARPTQPATNGNALVLKLAVAPELIRHVTNFKTTVTEQLSKRTSAAEAVAMSVINRGLGLSAESTVPEEEGLEKIVLGVFESSRKNLGANQSLHPGLLQALGNFKNNMIKTLEPKMGKLNAERLILSAVDRVLGFSDRSTMPGPESDRKQYDEAESVLISAIQRVVTEHQRTLAVAAASASAPQPASRPAPPSSTVAATAGFTPVSAKGHAPVSGAPVPGAYSTTAPLNSGTTSATPTPVSAYAATGSARPPVPAPSAPATKSATPTAPAQQVPRPTTNPAQISAAPTSQPRVQAPVSNAAQGSVQAPGQYSGARAGAQPQSPAHAVAQAQAQAAAQSAAAQRPTQPQPPAPAPVPSTAQAPGPPASLATPPAAATAQARVQEPLISQPQAPAQAPASAPSQLPPGVPVPEMSLTPGKSQARTSTPGPIPGTCTAPAPILGQTQAAAGPATSQMPAPKPNQAAPVAAPPAPTTTASQEKVSPTAPSASPDKISAPLPTSQAPSHSPAMPVTSAAAPAPAPAPAPAQPTPRTQTTTPAAATSQPPAPPAPMANMATASATTTTPAAAATVAR